MLYYRVLSALHHTQCFITIFLLVDFTSHFLFSYFSLNVFYIISAPAHQPPASASGTAQNSLCRLHHKHSCRLASRHLWRKVFVRRGVVVLLASLGLGPRRGNPAAFRPRRYWVTSSGYQLRRINLKQTSLIARHYRGANQDWEGGRYLSQQL